MAPLLRCTWSWWRSRESKQLDFSRSIQTRRVALGRPKRCPRLHKTDLSAYCLNSDSAVVARVRPVVWCGLRTASFSDSIVISSMRSRWRTSQGRGRILVLERFAEGCGRGRLFGLRGVHLEGWGGGVDAEALPQEVQMRASEWPFSG